MNATKFLHTQLLRPPLITPSFQTALQSQQRRLTPKVSPIKSRSSDEGESAPPDAVEIRFRRGTRRRQKEQSNNYEEPKKVKIPKKWEEMSVSEKAMELYVGEKGALFWLNKFAYASIFIIIGGWILFRFVGPSLNLYQLDAAPLAPEAMFKG